jgi:hypothetical protein
VKTKKLWRYVSIVAAVLLVFVAVGTVLGQEPDTDQGPPSVGIGEPAEFPDDVDEGSEGQVGPASMEEMVLAQPPYTMNYQGYLTDGSGNPLDGTYDMAFSLYDAATGGTREWGPETHNNVQVNDGLFSVGLGETVTLYPNDFDEALFLAVDVNGTVLSTRQPVRSVAYAFGLVPGAEVDGDPNSGNYGLYVRNSGAGSTDRGLYAYGVEYGIYAEEGGSGDIGIYSPDFVQAAGYKSNNDSYLWVPGTAAVLYPSTGCTLYTRFDGSSRLECSSSGTKTIHVPVTIPSVLYGQEVRVEQMTVYYDLENAASFVTTTILEKVTGAMSSDTLISNTTDRKSTSPTSYSLNTTGNYTLTSSSGPLNVQLAITHDGSTVHDVNIGAIRLRLGHRD